MTTARIVPIIMAGGSGTRLWPVSRESMPKQFVSLFGEDASTFQETLRRVSGPLFDRPVVVTSNDFRFICAEQMQAVGASGDIVLEPERRDSAAAVAVGTLIAAARDPNALCLVLASDHVIPDAAAFAADCEAAAESAAQGVIMTLGIRPTSPSSAYGYIEPSLDDLPRGATRLARFIEKPDRERAEEYVQAGYLWNSGNFLFSAERMLSEFRALAPDVLDAAEASLAAAVRDLDFLRLDPAAFAAAPKISIDYALMEKTRHAGSTACATRARSTSRSSRSRSAAIPARTTSCASRTSTPGTERPSRHRACSWPDGG